MVSLNCRWNARTDTSVRLSKLPSRVSGVTEAYFREMTFR